MSLTSRLIARLGPRIALLAVLPLLLAGCFRVDLAITVNDDGSGTMTMLVAFDESLLDLMGGQTDSGGDDGDGEGAVDPLEMLGGIDPSELPPGVTVDPYNEAGFVGARITVPFEATDDVAASIEQVFAGAEDGPFGDGGTPLEDFVLRKEADGGWRFEASATSPAGAEAGMDEAMSRMLLADATFTVRMRLPGEVVETNADEQTDDGELIWHLDPAGDDRTLMALTRPEGGGPNALLIGAAAALVVTAAVIGIGYWVRRRPAATEPDATP